ncbi:MAG: dihydropteroate synthase [Planctomycetaceae bacterium]|nr:MAG: dihydropteroate synthase [Planctomycetaceae bacterium]
MSREHFHFVTGRLAQAALQETVQRIADQVGFDYSIGVMPITVAALMTPTWIARRIELPPETTRVILPGYCHGDLQPLQLRCQVPVELGPKDLRQLPEHFGQAGGRAEDYGDHDIQILAEINHAPRLTLEAIRQQARQLAEAGADWIDVGCEPGDPWSGVGDCVRALRDDGHHVSIDSWNSVEVEAAVRAGARLVLSVNSSNWRAAVDWGCEVVVVPDDFTSLAGLDQTIEALSTAGVPLRIDPILEPIGCGFAASLNRYAEVRRRYPPAEMMMGIGNLTELTDADSAAINVLLLGICQELGIRSVLTTQVINWARSSVRECDLARRLVHYAVRHGVPPKRLESQLVLLRDPRVHRYGTQQLDQLAASIKDKNYRILAEDGLIHLFNSRVHLKGSDAFRLFAQLLETSPDNLDASHAFYLGYELAKATTALTLDKEYRQDEALDWGYLTVPEQTHRNRKS